MLTIAISSLSGGQGKTTTALLLGRKLASHGLPTLMIDADPQHNLTTYLGLELKSNSPTLLEFLKKAVSIEDTIYSIEGWENLFLIPADEQLDSAVDYLASSGVGATLLKRRLEPLAETFKVCVIDSPPQRSQICLTVIGAANYVVIPAEATIKGYGSLIRTLDLQASMLEVNATEAILLGVIPFRDRWVGLNQTQESRMAVEGMTEEVGAELMLPSMRESERYKQAINKQQTLEGLGYPDLEYPLVLLMKKIQQIFNNEQSQQSP